MKILIALQYYLPHRTGLTLHVQHIAESLAERGHQVTVLSARYNARLPRDERVINGVRNIRLWAPIRLSRGMIMPAYPHAAWQLIKEHDVASIHTPMAETPIYALYTKLHKKGLVITHHGDLILPTGFTNRFIEWITFEFYKMAGRAAHRIIAYSNDYADHSYYIQPFRAKTHAVHPPVKIPTPQPERVAQLRAEWGAGASQPHLIGFAGRFVQEKRPDVLINALETIHQTYPHARIIFAGQYDIEYEDFWQRSQPLIERHAPSLEFLGLIEDPQELANFYAAVDVLALPSESECFALVQVEAMLCGTPVVSTNIPGARIVVQKTGMGEVVPPHDPAAMGAAIVRILSDPAAYHRSLATINEAFSYEHTVDRYERFLIEAAEEDRNGHPR